jgi:anthranilate/para-aminobenzoate synthase component II
MKKFLLYTLVVLVLMQLYRPSKNSSAEPSKNSITTVEEVPENIQNILKRSCNDCHSNSTNYLWYHEIAPFSYVVAYHISDGKKHVNFDEWTQYNKDQKEHIIGDLREVIKSREMPMVGYLSFHPEAVISDTDNQQLLDWINSLESKEQL